MTKIDKINKEKEKQAKNKEKQAIYDAEIKKMEEEYAIKKERKKLNSLKADYKRFPRKAKAYLIILIGLLLSFMILFTNATFEGEKISSFSMWFDNLKVWETVETGWGWTKVYWSGIVFWLSMLISFFYSTVYVFNANKIEDLIYRLIWANKGIIDMHNQVIKQFKETDVYKDHISKPFIGKLRKNKALTDSWLHAEITRLYGLSIEPIECYLSQETRMSYDSAFNEYIKEFHTVEIKE